jgi:transposase
LEIYRNSDVIEKYFDILKHFQNIKRTKVYSDDAYDSKVFIGFLSMILISMIHRAMRDNSIYKDKSMEELLNELSAIKAIIIDGTYIIDPLTKRVKNHYNMFNCPYPRLD